MDRADLIDALGAMKANLVLEGVEHLYLFGSFARDEAADNSDVDLAFDISPDFEARFCLIDQPRIHRKLAVAFTPRSIFWKDSTCTSPGSDRVRRDDPDFLKRNPHGSGLGIQ